MVCGIGVEKLKYPTQFPRFVSEETLYDKIWERHVVDKFPTGQYQIFIGLHLIHDVTSSPAFGMLKETNAKVAYPERTFATADHMVPTDSLSFTDPRAEVLYNSLRGNAQKYGITFFGMGDERQGIVHIIGPELGLTHPGMTIACGDSHTSTHGAFGALAFGVGTTEIRYILETQTVALDKLKLRRISFDGELPKGVYAKDVILKIISTLGVGGGRGFAYEYAGSTIKGMTMDERMTLCNMSIEGGALIGYVNPDQTTFEHIKGREFAPKGENFERAVAYWKSVASSPDAKYDDVAHFNASQLEPMVTWGINPGQSVGISQNMPKLTEVVDGERDTAEKAYVHMGFTPGEPIYGTQINVAFIGSCTNSRISDLREAAGIFEGRKVADGVRALIVPGSYSVKRQAEQEGLDKIFEAGFAEQRAISRRKGDKPTLHFVFKTNILTFAASPWQRVFVEYGKRDDIDARYMHIDNFGMQMLLDPAQFDVVLTENMFGDIMTDIGAVLQGGIETAVSGNINPTGEYPLCLSRYMGLRPINGMDRMGNLMLL